MEEGSPFHAKGVEGIDRGIRRLIAERLEGLTIVTGVKRQRHGRLSFAADSVAVGFPVESHGAVDLGCKEHDRAIDPAFLAKLFVRIQQLE
jgi:hypothetical protein